MKSCMIIPLILLAAVPLAAQDEVLISGRVSHGGFGGPSLKLTQLNGQAAFMAGSRAGWIINHTFVLGSSNYSLLSKVDVHDQGDDATSYLAMNYSGLELEYIRDSDKLINYSIHTLFAPGTIHLKDSDFRRYTSNDLIFVLEPSLCLTLNIARFFRISLSGSYRLALDVDSGGLSNEDLRGAGGALTFKFGKF